MHEIDELFRQFGLRKFPKCDNAMQQPMLQKIEATLNQKKTFYFVNLKHWNRKKHFLLSLAT